MLFDLILCSNDFLSIQALSAMLSKFNAGMAKLVDALALGASGVTHGGSSPLPGTHTAHIQKPHVRAVFVCHLYHYYC